MDQHLHIHIHDDRETKEILHKIILKLNDMPTKADFDAAFATINDATNNIADDIKRLADQVAGGLSAADATAVVTQLNDVATKLQGIAAVTPDGTPTPPVV